MNRKTILTFALIMISYFSFAQNSAYADDQAIRKANVAFVNTIKYKKLNETVAATYPKFFTVRPKDQMIQMLNMTYSNPFLKVDIEDMKFTSVGKPELINGEYFSVSGYILKLRADASTLNDEMKKQISNMLTKKYGKENVKIASNGLFAINAPMKAVAVSKDKKDWKILLGELESKTKLQKILPKQIIEKL